MKVFNLALATSIFLFAACANAAAPKFNHSGIQKGAYTESCYREPCSGAKVMQFNVIKKTPTSTLIKLKLVGASRHYNSKKIVWNDDFHNVYINCSLIRPTIQIEGNDEITVLPLNASGVPGVLISDASLYLRACHNYIGPDSTAAEKFGYNVQESW